MPIPEELEKSIALDASLSNEANDKEAIRDIMDAFDVDEERARELWMRFIATVSKFKTAIQTGTANKELKHKE